jgi:hypothetical protein
MRTSKVTLAFRHSDHGAAESTRIISVRFSGGRAVRMFAGPVSFPVPFQRTRPVSAGGTETLGFPCRLSTPSFGLRNRTPTRSVPGWIGRNAQRSGPSERVRAGVRHAKTKRNAPGAPTAHFQTRRGTQAASERNELAESSPGAESAHVNRDRRLPPLFGNPPAQERSALRKHAL